MEGCRGGARFTLVRSDLSVLLPAAASVVCAMIFLSMTLFLVTMLLCYAGYIFLGEEDTQIRKCINSVLD